MGILRRARQAALLAAALLVAVTALVVVALGARSAPASPQQQAQEIAAGLHCPVCKDLSAAESPAPLARQMREQIREQLAAGRTPAEIRQGFVAAYGPTVLMTPPDDGWGRAVHLAPLLVLVTGLALGGALVRRAVRRRAQVEDAEPSRAALQRQIEDLADDLADGRIGADEHRRLLAELERHVARAPHRTPVLEPAPRVRAGGWTRRGLGIAVATAAAVGVTALLLSAVEQRPPAATADAGAPAAGPAASEADTQGLAEVEGALEQVKAHPQQASAHVELARSYAGVGQPQLAAVEYLAATHLDPGNAEANTALALVAFQAGNARQADALVSKALVEHPGYPEALYTRGLIRAMGLHQPAAATRDLRAYQQAAPRGSHRTTVATVLALLSSKAIR
jgi:cytochrome c-type biogenesis protein CcmH